MTFHPLMFDSFTRRCLILNLWIMTQWLWPSTLWTSTLWLLAFDLWHFDFWPLIFDALAFDTLTLWRFDFDALTLWRFDFDALTLTLWLWTFNLWRFSLWRIDLWSSDLDAAVDQVPRRRQRKGLHRRKRPVQDMKIQSYTAKQRPGIQLLFAVHAAQNRMKVKTNMRMWMYFGNSRELCKFYFVCWKQ